MRRYAIIILTVVSSLLLDFTCYSDKNRIEISNKLNKNIMCKIGFDYPNLKIPSGTKELLLANPMSEVDTGQTKIVNTLALCEKNVWDEHVKNNMLMLFVFDKDKLVSSGKPEDALIERRYYSYAQIMQVNGVIRID